MLIGLIFHGLGETTLVGLG